MTVAWYSPPSRWHPSRLWIGYASFVSRPVMPLAKFLYGETHKWFFRFAGTALGATYVSAVSIRFAGDARWVAYLLGFAAVAVVYWGLYAPSKWAYNDNLYQQSKDDLPFKDRIRPDPLLDHRVRSIVRPGGAGSHSGIPREIEVLREYVHLRGRYEKRGAYAHTRQWRPPGHWRGHVEYKLLEQTAQELNLWESGLLDNQLTLDHLDSLLEEEREASYTILVIALLLDDSYPKWRDKARRWDKRTASRWIAVWNWVRRRRGKPWIVDPGQSGKDKPTWRQRLLERRKESP